MPAPPPVALPPRSSFPAGFRFGVATSAYQVEGHAFGGAGRTHWDTFAALPGRVAGGQTGAIACDHYHLWPQDLDLAAAAGFDIYRFSFSWARLQPEGRGAVNPEGLAFYDRLIDGMLARGLAPFATLYHWELPAALSRAGGWAQRDIAGRLGDLADLVARRFGDRLAAIAPINEPWCVAWLSHFEGRHAPGLRDIRAAVPAMHHVLLAHGTAVAALRAAGVQQIGAVCNFEAVRPADGSAAAARAAQVHDAIHNRFFLEALRLGAYPDACLAGMAPHLPPRWEQDFPVITAPLDWFGVNYYTAVRIGAAAAPHPANPGSPWPGTAAAPPEGPQSGIGWEIRPEGLGEMLARVQALTGDLPLYITENGCGDRAAGLEDHARVRYFADHLAVVRAAIAKGFAIKGYVAWSLLDNYEWALGYDARFGLVHVDFRSRARTPKASYRAFAEALAQ